MKALTRLLQRVKSDLVKGENLDNYVAILLGLVFTALGVLGRLPQEWLNNSVLLTLTLLLVSSLKSRYVLEDVAKLLLYSVRKDASHALLDRAEYQTIDDRLLGATEVTVIGSQLSGFIGFYREAILGFAKQGCHFRFVVNDPNVDSGDASIKANIRRSLSILDQLEKDCAGMIHARLTKRSLPCAVFAVDIDSGRGLIQIQPHPLFKDTELRPHYDLRASSQSRWYEYYKAQIEMLWGDSAIYLP